MSSTLLKQSLAAIETLQARLEASQRAQREPIAIIGAACRFAGGADDPEALWRIARDGVDAIGHAPPGRGDIVYDPKRRGGFIADIDQFDPRFFGISPREAVSIDPQQRLLLETGYEALERSGLAVDTLAGSRTGVYVGMTYTDYGQLQVVGREVSELDQYVANGSALAAAAGRISFVFGFEGPSLTLDTACSSSLVAVHLAVQSLRAGECTLALAGGVSLMLRPKLTELLAGLGLMAADDACKPFDASADGFVRAEGCGMVALKRLSDAQAAGDPILAVIRGTAVNSDGRSSGLSTPHGPSQEAVIRTALANAGLLPADIDCVEAHGTGTAVGDPIEMTALAATLGAGRPAHGPLLVTAVKSNIGHAEAASGVAGLIKTVMALRHEQIAPTQHFRTPSPNIDWGHIAVRVPTEVMPWKRGTRIRRAGVSAFGFSGTNAHVILEEAPDGAVAAAPSGLAPDAALRLIPFAARGEAALRALAARHAAHLTGSVPESLDDYAVTMGRGRAALPSRLGVIAGSLGELRSALAEFAAGRLPAGVAAGEVRGGQRTKIAFLFTGQGAQYPGMGRGLYAAEPVFRATVDRCAGLLSSRLTRPLTELMGLGEAASSPELSAELGQTANTQPALFVFEYALATLWSSWGVVPQWVAGHSVGEYVAACVAGVFSLEDALDLIVERGRLMQALPPGGAMAAVFASETDVVPHLVAEVSIAAANGPQETVLAGPAASVHAVTAALKADGFDSRPLDVSHAFHSALLDPMLDEFEACCARVTLSAPRVPLLSNVTGKLHRPGVVPDARYWRRHARETVRFADCVETLRAAGATVLLELGPQPTLVSLARRAAPEATWSLLAAARRTRDDHREVLGALQSLYVLGVNPLWPADRGRRVALPTYPFQRSRYWMAAPTRVRGHPLLGERQLSPAAGARFLATMTATDAVFDAARTRSGRVQLSFAQLLEVAFEAARASGMSADMTVSRLRVERALELPDGHRRHVHTEVTPEEDGMRLQLRSAPCVEPPLDGQWQRHMTATLRPGRPLSDNTCPSYAQALERCGVPLHADLPPQASGAPRLSAVRLGGDIAVAELAPLETSRMDGAAHADVIDVLMQLVDLLLAQGQPPTAFEPRIAFGVEDAVLSARPAGALRAVVVLNTGGRHGGVTRADLRLETTDGGVVGLLNDVALRSGGDVGSVAAAPMERWPLHRLSRRWVAANNRSGSCQGLYALLAGESNAAREFAETLTTLLGNQGAQVVKLDCPAGSEVAASTLRAAFGGQAGIVIDCRALWPVAHHPTRAARMVYQRGLDLLQAVAQVDPGVGVCMLTRGALPVAAGDAIELQNTVLPGLLRTAAAEDPSRPILIADLDPGQQPAPECVVDLLKIVSLSQPEVAWRGRQAYTPTLVPVGAETSNRGQPTSASLPPIRGDGTYLVSGGLGGIGLRVAAWLAARGAGGVVLLGRQPATASQVEAVERLRGAGGCRIVCLSCDVSDLESLVALRGDALATLPPIRGVLHAAGVLADASLPNQDGARFETVARAKLDGSWCLHEFTKDDPVELMVFFSSVSAAFGAPGQANYAAANGFMDGLAAWRRANGQPALSVAWGPWATDGMAARLSPAQQARMKSYGMGFLESAAALEAMASIPNDESVVAVLEMAAERLMGQARPGLAGLLRGLKSTAGQSAGVAAAPEAPAPVAPSAAHPGTLGEALILEIARALGFEPDTLELDAPLSDLGLDSMMAIQLRGSFAKKCGVDLPLRLLLEGVSTRALVAQCNERESDGPVTTAIPDATASTAEVALDEGML